MRAAACENDFRSAPYGAYLAGPHALYFCARPGLCGIALWGQPDADDLRRLERLLLLDLEPGVPRHLALVDAGRVDGVDAAAFTGLAAYLRDRHDALARRVERLAVVRPPGLPGATVAGIFRVASTPYPVEVVSNACAGLRWLGETDDSLATTLDAAIAEAAGLPPVLVALRRILDARSRGLPLDHAAETLGLSTGTLQRQLSDAGATYVAEVGAAQIRAAQRLMLDSNLQVTEIAVEVGCPTPQQFSSLFRRLVGESPSTWRDRHRR